MSWVVVLEKEIKSRRPLNKAETWSVSCYDLQMAQAAHVEGSITLAIFCMLSL